MQRRQFLTGIAAGLPLLAGCTSLLGGGSVINSSSLSTYTSDKYGYSVKYPSEWSKSQKGMATVQFESESEEGGMITQCIPGVATSMGQDEYMDLIIQGFSKTAEEFSTSNKRDIELPNGSSGKAIHIKMSRDSNSLQGQAVFASDDKNVYDAIVFVVGDKYEATKPAIEEILKSLTIKK